MTDSVLGHCPPNTYDTYTWIYRKGQMPIIMERVMLRDPGPSHHHHSEVERSEKASGTGLVPTQGTLLGQSCARWCRQYCLHISFLSCVHRKKVDRSWRTPGCRSLHSNSKVYLTTYDRFLLVLDALISDCQVSQRWNNQLTAQHSSESQNHTEWEVQSSTVLKNVGENYKKKYWEK